MPGRITFAPGRITIADAPIEANRLLLEGDERAWRRVLPA
jgi:hypothetical protein